MNSLPFGLRSATFNDGLVMPVWTIELTTSRPIVN
jgi:hypothetical protein